MDQIERKLTHDIKKINRELCCIREAITIGYSGIVDNFIDLPLASDHTNQLYYVINTSPGSIGNVYYSDGSTWVSSLTLFDTRITNLENNVYKVTYYEVVSGASGSLTTPSGTTLNADEFGNSGNAILSKINGANKPIFESPMDAGGNIVTATLNVGTGAWAASGVYTDTYVALIYSVNITAEDFSNLNNFYIVESEKIGIMYTFSTGLTKSITDVVTANLSTGIAGGQSVKGGINASENLTLSSTAHATKGKILFGASAYDEVNDRLGINNPSPIYLSQFDCTDHTGSTTDSTVTVWNKDTSGTGVFSGFRTRVGSGEEGGSFIGSRYGLNTFGIANGLTVKTNASGQDFGITTSDDAILGTATGVDFLFKNNGGAKWKSYGAGTFTGTATHILSVDVNGNIIETIVKTVGTELSSAATSINADLYYQWNITALAVANTIAAPTGTLTDGQSLIIRIKDDGTPHVLGWNGVFRASSDLPLPLITIANKTLYLGFKYNLADSKWDLIALLNNF